MQKIYLNPKLRGPPTHAQETLSQNSFSIQLLYIHSAETVSVSTSRQINLANLDTKRSLRFRFSVARKKRKECKTRRQRTTFSNEQTLHLENEFRVNEYIPRTRRYELAEYLRLTETQIKIWFQNRRAKDKRIEKAQLDQQYRLVNTHSYRYFRKV